MQGLRVARACEAKTGRVFQNADNPLPLCYPKEPGRNSLHICSKSTDTMVQQMDPDSFFPIPPFPLSEDRSRGRLVELAVPCLNPPKVVCWQMCSHTPLELAKPRACMEGHLAPLFCTVNLKQRVFFEQRLTANSFRE